MRGSVLRPLAVGTALAVLLLLVWTAVVLLQVRGDLEHARAVLTAAGEGGSAGTTDLAVDLVEAERRLARSSSRLRAPAPALTAQLPLVGRTPEAVRRTTDAALVAVRAARGVLSSADAGPLLVDGRVDLDRLAAVAAEAQARAASVEPVVGRLRGLDLGLVPGKVADGVLDARAVLDDLPADLRQASAALDALRGLLGDGGERRLLVVVQNNAELRGTGGLVSVFAEATAADGRLQLEAFRDVEEVADPPGEARPVPAPDDYVGVFGPLLANTTLWKNTNADPDVPRSSAVLAEVAGATLGTAPDAVVWLDVRALGAVLGATSPAVLPDGTELTEENVVEVLLSEAYETVADDDAAQAVRRARLRAAGDAVAERLLQGTPDATGLASGLAGSARGRHLAVWSADEQEQQAWSAAGLAGDVAAGRADLVSFAVHNLGGGDADGNKLDVYARRSLEVSVRLTSDAALVQRVVELHNGSPVDGLPAYVAGEVAPGTTNNLVLHSVPPGAEDVVLERGDDVLAAVPRPLGDSRVLTDVVSLPPGTSATWRLSYRLPVADGRYSVQLVPQPLAVDAALSLSVEAADGGRLSVPPGSPLSGDDGPLTAEGPFDEVVEAAVDVERPGLLGRAVDAVRRFWREPVELPF